MRRPLLATSADGVGTKVAIAQALDKHDTIGFDLVGMLVDDLVVCGAEPLFLTDYIACGKVVPERIAEIVKGIRKHVSSRAARCSEARPQSIRVCWARMTTTWPGRRPVSWKPINCSGRSGYGRETGLSRWLRRDSTRTVSPWYDRCCSPTPAGGWTG